MKEVNFGAVVPVLQVSNVAQSVRWYREVLGFDASTFPESEPWSFALLSRDGCELMLQVCAGTPVSQGWAVYVRLNGSGLLDLADRIRAQSPLLREPQRMPYGEVEFSVADPDGYEIVLSEQLDDDAAVPSVAEPPAT